MAIILRINTAQTGLDIAETSKGAPLNNVQLDTNFQELNTAVSIKAPKNNPVFLGSVQVPAISSTALDNTSSDLLAARVDFVKEKFATKDSPTFSGNVTVPTLSAGSLSVTSSDAFATNAGYVKTYFAT